MVYADALILQLCVEECLLDALNLHLVAKYKQILGREFCAEGSDRVANLLLVADDVAL